MFSGPDFTDKAAVVKWFQEEFAGWDPLWTELFRKASFFAPRPQYCAPLDQKWDAQSDLTLLGNATHVMPPYAGEGVNMAMQDAMELADCLVSDSFPDIQTAIGAYETKMRARASETARETMEFTGIFHSPEAASFFVNFFNGNH